jgi:hypothetical protein
MKAQKEAYMARQAWITVLAGSMAIGGAIVAAQSGARGDDAAVGAVEGAGNRGGFVCSDRTVRGTYGILMQGTRPVPPASGGGIEAVMGVVIRTYDGAGNFTQVDNIKGFITGIVRDREAFGTYQVNADCSASTQFQPPPGVPAIEERMVIVDGGREIRSITASPQPTMVTTVQQRIDRR